MDAVTTDQYLMYARTIQAKHIKTLVETLKELLIDTNIQFTSDGMRIIDLDNTRVVMIHMKLHAEKFETYVCKEPVTTGVNLADLNKLMKTVDNTDTLTFFLDRSDYNRLGIRVENDEKRTRTEYKLNLLELDSGKLSIADTVVKTCVVLDSAELNKIVKKMASLSGKVEMKSVGDKLMLTCIGESCTQETIIQDACANDEDNGGEIVQGVFSLRYLVLFCKCQTFSDKLELYIQNDYPLIIRYANSTLGELKLCLSPMVDE
jgi:proliferating cell nuclear antigen